MAGLSEWLMKCRLDFFAVYLRDVAPDDRARIGLVKAATAKTGAAAARIPALLAEGGGGELRSA